MNQQNPTPQLSLKPAFEIGRRIHRVQWYLVHKVVTNDRGRELDMALAGLQHFASQVSPQDEGRELVTCVRSIEADTQALRKDEWFAEARLQALEDAKVGVLSGAAAREDPCASLMVIIPDYRQRLDEFTNRWWDNSWICVYELGQAIESGLMPLRRDYEPLISELIGDPAWSAPRVSASNWLSITPVKRGAVAPPGGWAIHLKTYWDKVGAGPLPRDLANFAKESIAQRKRIIRDLAAGVFGLAEQRPDDQCHHPTQMWTIDGNNVEVAGEIVSLQPKSIELMDKLIDSSRPVRRERLRDELWPNDVMTGEDPEARDKKLRNQLTRIRNGMRRQLGLAEDFDPFVYEPSPSRRERISLVEPSAIERNLAVK